MPAGGEPGSHLALLRERWVAPGNVLYHRSLPDQGGNLKIKAAVCR